MHTIRRIALLVSAAALILLGLAATNAPAAHAGWNPNAPTASVSYGSQYGWVVRAVMRENGDGSGYSLTAYGSSSCSGTTSDRDFTRSTLPDSRWDNNVSWASDFNPCDTALYDRMYTSGTLYGNGIINFASGSAVNGSQDFNDKTSSFYLS